MHDLPHPFSALVIDLLLTPKDNQNPDLLDEFWKSSKLGEDSSLADTLFPVEV
jgi:hypothetical protein